MNVLVLLLVVGGSLAIGMASLENGIGMNVQELGVGEKTIDTPISAGLTLLIERTTNPIIQTDYKDLIVFCKFTLEVNQDPILSGSMIYCKLLDEFGSVIAEGVITLTEDLDPGESVNIPINDIFVPNANNIDEVYDVVFVVKGPPQ